MKQFVFTEWNKKKLGILFEDGKAMEIRCYEADSILGNVYRARVSNLSPNINAAWISKRARVVICRWMITTERN